MEVIIWELHLEALAQAVSEREVIAFNYVSPQKVVFGALAKGSNRAVWYNRLEGMTVLQKIDNIASNIGTLSSLLTTNKSSLVAAVNELNNKMAYRVVNASGSSKQVINEEWVYLGTNITVPPGCFAILYAFRAWNSGKPKGLYFYF